MPPQPPPLPSLPPLTPLPQISKESREESTPSPLASLSPLLMRLMMAPEWKCRITVDGVNTDKHININECCSLCPSDMWNSTITGINTGSQCQHNGTSDDANTSTFTTTDTSIITINTTISTNPNHCSHQSPMTELPIPTTPNNDPWRQCGLMGQVTDTTPLDYDGTRINSSCVVGHIGQTNRDNVIVVHSNQKHICTDDKARQPNGIKPYLPTLADIIMSLMANIILMPVSLLNKWPAHLTFDPLLLHCNRLDQLVIIKQSLVTSIDWLLKHIMLMCATSEQQYKHIVDRHQSLLFRIDTTDLSIKHCVFHQHPPNHVLKTPNQKMANLNDGVRSDGDITTHPITLRASSTRTINTKTNQSYNCRVGGVRCALFASLLFIGLTCQFNSKLDIKLIYTTKIAS